MCLYPMYHVLKAHGIKTNDTMDTGVKKNFETTGHIYIWITQQKTVYLYLGDVFMHQAKQKMSSFGGNRDTC